MEAMRKRRADWPAYAKNATAWRFAVVAILLAGALMCPLEARGGLAADRVKEGKAILAIQELTSATLDNQAAADEAGKKQAKISQKASDLQTSLGLAWGRLLEVQDMVVQDGGQPATFTLPAMPVISDQ